jgi:hypothetical protein
MLYISSPSPLTWSRNPPSAILRVVTSAMDPFRVTEKAVGLRRTTPTSYLRLPVGTHGEEQQLLIRLLEAPVPEAL